MQSLSNENEEYLTAAEACELLGVQQATLYAYVSRGLLKSYKQGIRRQRLYKRSEIDNLLAIRPDEDGDEPRLPRAETWMHEK